MVGKLGVLLIATMDTKAEEGVYIEECFEREGVSVYIMDPGIQGNPSQEVSISRHEVARAAGMKLEEVQNLGDEGKASQAMTSGAVRCALDIFKEGKIHGIISLGGSMGTTLGTAVMRAFPVGFPKVMISTMASSNTRPYVGSREILMLHSVCDFSGINRITGKVLRNGALALAGMIKGRGGYATAATPVIVLSTLGTTEACSKKVRQALEEMGYEVLIFHSIGSGGEAMEDIIREEDVAGVIDLSLNEIGNHQFGGDYDAGPERGRGALQKGVPTVLVPGNIDILGGGPLRIAQQRFPGRLYHVHNAAITAMRTTRQEIEVIAGILASNCNEARGPLSCIVPTEGFSAFDRRGSPFYDPDASRSFIEAFKGQLSPRVPLQILPYHINDPEFAEKVIAAMDELLTGP